MERRANALTKPAGFVAFFWRIALTKWFAASNPDDDTMPLWARRYVLATAWTGAAWGLAGIFIAQDLREWMARMGFRTVEEMVGRTEIRLAFARGDYQQVLDIAESMGTIPPAGLYGWPELDLRRRDPAARIRPASGTT